MANTDSLTERKASYELLGFDALEAYKQIRANLSFIIPEEENKRCRVIGVTSSNRGEGKSTTSLNLAYVISQADYKVLLIDCDMRLPSIDKKLNIERARGLSNVLSSRDIEDIGKLKVSFNGKWDVLTAGDIPPNPSELLGSPRFKKMIEVVSEHYDYCIVDLPPVNIVSDAIVVSHALDGLIVVVREKYTRRDDIAECMRKLKTVNAHVLGIIANDVRSGEGKYRYYKKGGYKYYNKYYSHYGYGHYGANK